MKIKQILAVVLSMALVAAISITATIAYFTDSDAVTNTFTIGKVKITMDETDTDNSTEGENDRDQANEYHLLPGQTYDKDPIVHVEKDSEDCFVYVKVENGLAGIEKAAAITVKGESGAEDTIECTIKDQILANGWRKLESVTDVYYREHAKSDEQVDYTVFTKFAISDDATNESIAEYATGTDGNGAKINVTAYAIQMAGFEGKPLDAWNAGKWK